MKKVRRARMSHKRTSPATAMLRSVISAERRHRRRPEDGGRPLPRVQLRLKVMAGVVVVTLVALVAFDVAAVTTMRRYLLGQTDSNLQGALTLTEPRLDALLSGGVRPGRPGGGHATPAQFRPSPGERV